MVSKDGSNEPRLSVNPTIIDFGVYDPSSSDPSNGRQAIKITNSGSGMLAGRINPQVAWITANPPNFRCAEGESSDHIVQLLPTAPITWKTHKFSFDFIFLINSNGGSTPLSGEYTAVPGEKLQGHPTRSTIPSVPTTWIGLIAVLLVILIVGITAGIYLIRHGGRVEPIDQTSLLYTQAASTVLAQLAPTQPVQVSSGPAEPNQPSGMFNFISTITTTPQLEEATNTIEATFTPWPRNQFPNPEQVVKDYYSSLNYGNYEKSWSMLSHDFQQGCCNVGGNNPYLVYSNWWHTIKYVDVVSTTLQQWDTNPAILYVSLRYHTKDERTLDTFNIFMLISDPVRKTLLIDKVK
jgi:hypothetical protein